MEAYKRKWITSVCPSHQLMRIDEGMIIEGPFRPEPEDVNKVDEFGDRVHIIGATIYSNTLIDQLISGEALEQVKTKEFILGFSVPGSETLLSIEAERYRFAFGVHPKLLRKYLETVPLYQKVTAETY